MGVLFLGIGLGVGLHIQRLDARLDTDGKQVAGVVLGKERSAPANGSESYRVIFRFDGPQGESVRGSAEVDAAAWDSVVERGPIDIVYLPDRPGTYRVVGQRREEAIVAIVFGLLGATLALVGGFVLGAALRNRSRARMLERRGTLTSASVIDVALGNLRINGVPQWTLRYRYRDAQGRTHNGACTVAPEDAGRWRAGSVGRVRYDPRKPRSHVWVGEG